MFIDILGLSCRGDNSLLDYNNNTIIQRVFIMVNLPKKTASTVIFESDKIKASLVARDKDNKVTEAGRKQIEAHTLRIQFDFDKVTDEEILNFLVSTTSAMKMFQNNVAKHWTEKDILEYCAKGVYVLKVRDLLDNRESKSLTDEEQRKRWIQVQIKKGKTPAQIKEELLASLEELEG